MADRQFVLGGTQSAPADWIPPASLEIIPKTAFATFDGTNASGGFVPCLEIISDSGHPVALCRVADEVAAGASAVVSWFPGGELDTETAASGSGAGSGSGSGSGSGGELQVTDGTTTVASVVDLDFVSGATVTAGGAGAANVTLVGSGTPSFSGARVFSSTNQSIPNNTDTLLNFDTVRYDVGGYANLGTHPQRLTAPVTGYYLIGGSIAFPSGDFYGQIVIALNGNLAQDHQLCGHTTSVPNGNDNLCINTIWKLTAGDFVGLDVVQASGGAADSLTAPPQCPEFWISLLGV